MGIRISVSFSQDTEIRGETPKVAAYYGATISVFLQGDTEISVGDTESRSLLWGEDFGTSGMGTPTFRRATPKVAAYYGAKSSVPLVRVHRKFVERQG